MKNSHQNCTRASISIEKKQKVKLELELEVPFKIIELASKDRNQKVLFKSKEQDQNWKIRSLIRVVFVLICSELM